MTIRNFLVFYFLCSSSILFSTRFDSFSEKIISAESVNELKKIWLKEKALSVKKQDAQQQLKLRFIEAFIADKTNQNELKIKKLLWIIDHSSSEFEIKAHANYHLSSLLNSQNSHELARFYAKEALLLAKKLNLTNLLHLCYSLSGSIEYNSKNYDIASNYYLKAFQKAKASNLLFKASMLNNNSLCLFKMGDIEGSSTFIYRSLHYLNQIKNPNKQITTFKHIVEGNLGTNFLKNGNIPKAILYLEKEVNYYVEKQVELENASKPLEELIKCYTTQGNSNGVLSAYERLKYLENKFRNSPKSFPFTKAILNYYIETKQLNHIPIYTQKNNLNTTYLIDSIQQNTNSLSNVLYEQEVDFAKNEINHQRNINIQAVKSKQRTSVFLIIIFSIVLIGLLVFYKERMKQVRKNSLIEEQKLELEENKRKLLENELKINQEKITKLALNLTIKKEMEKAFLHQLKEIKRRKTVDPAILVKELQQNLTHLLQIDDKQTSIMMSDENAFFMKKLKEKQPQLNELELQLCSYAKLNLSSKDIASLTGMSSGTIRVYKTKIKHKLSLSENELLVDYLNNI